MTKAAQMLPPMVLERIAEHGNGFRAAREAAGVTFEELSERSSIELERIVAFEHGDAAPTEAEAAELAVALGVPTSFFLE